SLHDALPISGGCCRDTAVLEWRPVRRRLPVTVARLRGLQVVDHRVGDDVWSILVGSHTQEGVAHGIRAATRIDYLQITFPARIHEGGHGLQLLTRDARSEERRVGKECRSRWSP